jgi:sirohydrochlorin ferrochelatase
MSILRPGDATRSGWDRKLEINANSNVPLVAIAHGSRDPRHAATITTLMAVVARLRPGLQIETAYLDHCAPSVGQVFDRLAGGGVREAMALPLLLTPAYHVKADVPAVLHETAAHLPHLTIHQASALGPHPLLAAALGRRLDEAGVRPGDAGTGIVLASAGSTDPEATRTIASLATRLRQAGWGRAVRAAFASARPPTVVQAAADLREANGARRIVVASCFLAPGFLPDRIVAGAVAVGAEAVTEPLGTTPELATLVLHRYDQARTAWTSASALSA